ncbi:MAG: hypothetical protein V7606_2675 [Burkholderiales bacterium]
MSHLDILLPFGLPPEELAADLFRELKTPALATLIGRAKSQSAASRHQTYEDFSRALPHETWLARQFGLESGTGSPPIAVAAMQAFGLPAEAGVWFILNPVHIHVARDHLVLTDSRQVPLSEQESRALFEMAQPLFSETGKTLLYANAQTWFARADEWGQLQTSTPDAASGHNIDIWMPKGPGERDWRKLQNEVQMHWFTHEVNAEREARGIRPVNSIWLWGGTPATVEASPTPYSQVFNLDGWMRAFGRFSAKPMSAATPSDIITHAPHRGLLVLDALLEPALANDWSQWLDQLHAAETNWLAPLLASLKSGKIDQLSLILTHHARTSTFTASRPSLRKFWVQPSLAPLLS